jgi:DNA-binding IclR family transcriptional regulator
MKQVINTIKALRLLSQKPLRASQLQEILGTSKGATYRIIRDLRASGEVVEKTLCTYSIKTKNPKPQNHEQPNSNLKPLKNDESNRSQTATDNSRKRS